MLANLNVQHKAIDADLLSETDREAMLAELRAVNPSCPFPTTVVMAGPSACAPRSTTSTLGRRISVETYFPGFGGMRDDPGLYGGLRDGFEYREGINKGHG